MAFRTDPRFETYNSSGYVYKADSQSLLLKSRHKTQIEKIRMSYIPVPKAAPAPTPAPAATPEPAESTKTGTDAVSDTSSTEISGTEEKIVTDNTPTEEGV